MKIIDERVLIWYRSTYQMDIPKPESQKTSSTDRRFNLQRQYNHAKEMKQMHDDWKKKEESENPES